MAEESGLFRLLNSGKTVFLLSILPYQQYSSLIRIVKKVKCLQDR